MTDSGSDNLRDELQDVIAPLVAPYVSSIMDPLDVEIADAFVPVVERWVAAATAPLEAKIAEIRAAVPSFPREQHGTASSQGFSCECIPVAAMARVRAALASGQEEK